MSRAGKGARLYLRAARRDAAGRLTHAAVWLIRDGPRTVSTRFGASARAQAETALADYISAKYAPERRERPLDQIAVADVMAIYLADVAPGQARPEKAGERAERILGFFGRMTLSEITGKTCRAYAEWRGNSGGARRDLQDLAAAINHHAKEGLHRGVVRVVLPPRGKGRQRWLSRSEAARLLLVCWRTREAQALRLGRSDVLGKDAIVRIDAEDIQAASRQGSRS